MDLIIASTNKGKIKELKEMLEGYNINVLSLKDINFTNEIVEDGKTFEENALIKAKTISKLYNKITLADDSGIEVEALNNAPGIYSARYSGGNDDDNNALLLKNLEGKSNRRARYSCAIVLYFPNDTYKTFMGYCYGEIGYQYKGTNGFGYDPLFYLKEYDKTMAELDSSLKNKISHRYNALKGVLDNIDEILNYK